MVNKCKIFIQSAISNYWILLYDLSYEKIYKWTETKKCYIQLFSLILSETYSNKMYNNKYVYHKYKWKLKIEPKKKPPHTNKQWKHF